MGFKDHFSTQSSGYSRYRPGYPDALFQYLASISPGHSIAWDCATGSGQAALGLAGYFDQVIATDASDHQVANAFARDNVAYRVAPVEQVGLPDQVVDLVTVAQALHWFDREVFFKEVRRILRPGGVIAVWSYNRLQISERIDAVVEYLYTGLLGSCWPPERQLVEEGYLGIEFPFDELETPEFHMEACWTLAQLTGYLGSWSAVQKYKEVKGVDPVDHIQKELEQALGHGDLLRVHWPLAIRVGLLKA